MQARRSDKVFINEGVKVFYITIPGNVRVKRKKISF